MTPALVLCLSLGGSCAAEPPVVRPNPVPVLPTLDVDRYRRQHLDRLRQARALIESNIELFEKQMRDFPEFYTPERVSRMRQDIEVICKEVETMKKRERELWEQQPGGITAPMPREKK